MSVASIKAGQAFYEIFADDKTQKGLDSAEARLKRFGARIGLIGSAIAGFAAAGLTGLGLMVKAFASSGDDIATAMSTTGMSGDFLQSLKFGAAGVGVSFEGLVSSITHFNTVLAKAATGNKKAAQTLADFGLSVNQLLAMSPDDRFKAVADAIAGIADPGLRAAAAVKLLGSAGAKLVDMLANGGAGLAQALSDMQAKGLILSPADIELAKKAQGAWMLLGASMRHVVALVGASVAPIFLKVAAVLQSVVEQIAKFINNNRGLVAGLAMVLGAVLAVGVALMALGAASILISFIAEGFGILAAIFGFIFSPLGLLVGLLIAAQIGMMYLAYEFAKVYRGGIIFQFLNGKIAQSIVFIKALWQAMVNARWDLAGQLIMDGLNLAFTSGITGLMMLWLGFRDFIISSMIDAMAGVLQLIQDAGALVGIDMGLGDAGAFAEEVKKTLNDTTNEKLAGRQQKYNDALAKYNATLADIAKLDTDKKLPGKDDLRDYGSLSDTLKQMPIFGEGVGATLSSNAARLSYAAPANSVDEKQLDVLMDMDDKLKELLELGGEGGLFAD